MTALLEMLDINTGLALGVGVLSLLWWFSVRRPAGAPPGPWLAVPLLGHLLLLMKKDTLEQFAAWRRQYGDVFSLYLGSRLVVVFNGYKVLKEALVNNADTFSDRPHFPLLDFATKSKGSYKLPRLLTSTDCYDKGFDKHYSIVSIEILCNMVTRLWIDVATDLLDSVGDTSGAVWKDQRKVSLDILRELGMGKNVLAVKVQEEIKEYIRVISESQGQPLDLSHLTQA
ncbi:hypothetical protein C0Q70_11691 [Pomacea canaliculata]|uniref:Uncharacterized protein n=1 Tax=Pomacea canaliculata TaxID=400727 RepID=A0A2T7P6P2_POMCA|nr:hypothetical protein C0Q70_11691 [Pomacea canaliculata]